jgi:hypothetical protein
MLLNHEWQIAGQRLIDLADHALSRFLIIVPDGNHGTHDCPVGMQN